MIRLKKVESQCDYKLARGLFFEYTSQLSFDLGFQNFQNELERIDINYAEPQRALFIAYNKEQLLGCVGVRKIDDTICELKRMYLRREAREKGIGNSCWKSQLLLPER